MTDDIEERMRRMEYAIWGLRGDNGMVSDIRAIREWQVAEDKRREEDELDRLAGQRAVILALLAAVIALIGTVASLVAAGVIP